MLLESFEPIHGVLLCEGEDLDPSLYDDEPANLSAEEIEEIRRQHASDTTIDKEKDNIELRLAKLCLERNIPYLGICRGSQVNTKYNLREKGVNLLFSIRNILILCSVIFLGHSYILLVSEANGRFCLRF